MVTSWTWTLTTSTEVGDEISHPAITALPVVGFGVGVTRHLVEEDEWCKGSMACSNVRGFVEVIEKG